MNPSNPGSNGFRKALARLGNAPHPPATPTAPATPTPEPEDSAYQIPWSDPEFSTRMLQVHLDPDTHMASRRPATIDRHVDWLCSHLAQRSSTTHSTSPRVLDVACGPGLYLHRMARRGFQTIGFDFAPAPLTWARDEARRQELDCRFLELDLTALPRDLEEQIGPVDLLTFWFGEFHSFAPRQMEDILPRLARCLRPGGVFVLEYQPLDIFVQEDTTAWSWQESSVFCPRPHLWLQEWGWDPDNTVETHVHWILERDSGKLHRYVQCHHAYEDEELVALLDRCGLVDPVFQPPLSGADEEFEFPVLSTRRAAG